MIVFRADEKNLRSILYVLGKMMGAFKKEARDMTRDLAEDYKAFLISNIVNERYASDYPELSEKYVQWKSEHGGQEGFWKLWGDLVKAISIRSTDKGHSVGVERDVMPSKTSSIYEPRKETPVWQYAYYGEFGRDAFQGQRVAFGPQPPRPVFTPSSEEFRTLFVKKRQEGAFNRIISNWGKS